jgi:hypothetical protein
VPVGSRGLEGLEGFDRADKKHLLEV